MEWWHAVILGVIEGVTEFLPVSSTGHLTIAEKLMGYQIDSVGITAFTAIIQIGAILSAIIYFREDIIRVAGAWLAGLFNEKARKKVDYKFGWAVIIGSLPIAVIGLVFKDELGGLAGSDVSLKLTIIGHHLQFLPEYSTFGVDLLHRVHHVQRGRRD